MVVLSIIKYKKRYIPFAFLAMALWRIPLYSNKKISFWKLMGSGKNGTFDKIPDLQQWAVLSVYSLGFTVEGDKHSKDFSKSFYGSFIGNWLKIFNPKITTYFLESIEGHGFWDKKQPFGQLPAKTDYEGAIAVLTRATIRMSKLKSFWKNVPNVANQMANTKGFITSYGIGEIPWIKQATISFWQSKEDMKNFAYKMQHHAQVIQKTRKENWYKEDMFVRFKILHCIG